MAQPTIRDVAALAGVAPSTVSVVLNEVEGARVSSDTRRRVREAAEVLGYTGNDNARHLRRGRRAKTTVALVNDVIAAGPYGGALIEGAQAAAWRHGALLAVLNTQGHPDREAEALRAARQHHADAVVLASLSLHARPVPDRDDVVLANAVPAPGSRAVPHVVPEEWGAGGCLARELIELGHTRIAVATVTGSLAATARLRGFRAALRRAGIALEDAAVVRSNPVDATADGGYRAARALLADDPSITALWCFNDRMAMGAYRAAAEAGRVVPETLTIVGFDNLEPVAESLAPSLTTMALPYYEIGELAVEIALDRRHPVRRSPSQRARVASTLIRRFSAAACCVPEAVARAP